MENYVDVSDAFAGWTQTVNISRKSTGSYVNGRWVPTGGPTTVPVQAVVQNANPNDLKVLPEGLRTEESLKLHSSALLRSVSEEDANNADTFTYDSKNWLVYWVADRKIGGYYKAIAMRQKR